MRHDLDGSKTRPLREVSEALGAPQERARQVEIKDLRISRIGRYASTLGHPTPQTLERLQRAFCDLRSHDDPQREHGDVIVIVHGEKADSAATKRA